MDDENRATSVGLKTGGPEEMTLWDPGMGYSWCGAPGSGSRAPAPVPVRPRGPACLQRVLFGVLVLPDLCGVDVATLRKWLGHSLLARESTAGQWFKMGAAKVPMFGRQSKCGGGWADDHPPSHPELRGGANFLCGREKTFVRQSSLR